MVEPAYSFLDVAILDEVRERFAAGDALVVLSSDLEEVIWANGPGANFLGYPDIAAALGEASRLSPVARRQIMATRGYPEIGKARPMLVRLALGLSSQAVQVLASSIHLPDDEQAILLAVPFALAEARDPGETAARAASGFAGHGQFAAMLDAEGRIEAATPGFEHLGVPPDALRELIAGATAQGERLVKRMFGDPKAAFPIGIARLADQPARYLLVLIDERQAAGETRPVPATAPPPRGDAGAVSPEVLEVPLDAIVEHATTGSMPADLPADAGEDEGQAVAVEDFGDHDMAITPDAALATDSESVEEAGAGRRDGANDLGSQGDVSAETNRDTVAPDVASSQDAAEIARTAAGQHDDWYFREPARSGEAPAAPATLTADSAETAPVASTVDRAALPLRFVWRTDSEGRLSQLSDEFADAMGLKGSDVVGRSFRDVSGALGLDPDGEIAGLLERRDTWSGRSVMWPVAGTDLRVPVDLAALPIYDRNRVFEGFRGFGIARLADAVVDPDATGLALDLSTAVEPEMTVPVAETPAPFLEADTTGIVPADLADPFEGEVPALAIEPQPDRRQTDKIIRLAEHRPANDKGLSPTERIAFREIGDRLKQTAGESEAMPAGINGGGNDAAAQTGDTPAVDAAAELSRGEPAAMAPAGESAGTVASEDSAAPADDVRDGEAADLAVPDPLGSGAIPDPVGVGGLPDTAASPSEASAYGEASDDSAAAPQPARRHRKLSLLDYAPAAAEPEVDAEITETEPSATLTGEAEEAGASEFAGDIGSTDPSTTDTPAHQASGADATSANAEVSPVSMEASGETTPDVAELVQADDGGAPAEAADPTTPSPVDEPAASTTLAEEDVEPRADEEPVPSPRTDTSILERLPVPVLIHAGDSLYYANPEFLALSGHASLAELEQAGGLGTLFVEPYEGDTSNGADHSLKLRDSAGSEHPIEAVLRSVPWNGGSALMLVVRRTNEQFAAAAEAVAGEREAQLKARIAEMRTIIDTATDGVVLIARDGIIRSISRPAEAMFGFDAEDVVGKPFASLFAPESQRSASDYLGGLVENGVASVLNDGREVIGREAQGRFIPMFMTIGRLPGDTGFCAVLRDITQWKRAEEELTQARAQAEHASSLKTDFLARVSHEIRTPLNAIIGFSELMVDEKFGPVGNERYKDYLRDINRSGSLVLDLVNDLLDISKIEAGQQEMSYEAVSLNDTLTETVALMQPQANRERVIIRSSFASRLPEVVADLRSIRQIALNILSNAIRYTPAGGQVIVSTAYEPSGDVVFRVRDTGVGMSPAEIEQALKPFKQINALKRTRGDGTGLGLPLTKAMVEANRARFAIASTPGEGTLVEIVFPTTRVLAQ